MGSIFSYFSPSTSAIPFFAVDIGSKSIRVLELKRVEGKIRLGRFGERFLETPITDFQNISQHEELKKILQSLKREFQLQSVKVSIPEENSYIFNTTIEKGTSDEIRRNIEFHLEENIPIPRVEAVFDYNVFGVSDSDRMKAIVTVMPKKTVESYTELFKGCGITIASFLLEPVAISRSVVAKGDNNTYLVVNFTDTRSSISIISDGVPQFISTLSLGFDNFSTLLARDLNISLDQAQNLVNKNGLLMKTSDGKDFSTLFNPASALKEEINRVYIYWHSRQNSENKEFKKIEKVILCGRGSSMPGFSDYLAVGLKVPVELANVWTNVLSFDEEIPIISLDQSLNYAAAIGLLIN